MTGESSPLSRHSLLAPLLGDPVVADADFLAGVSRREGAIFCLAVSR